MRASAKKTDSEKKSEVKRKRDLKHEFKELNKE
jgi:hypothetical protein